MSRGVATNDILRPVVVVPEDGSSRVGTGVAKAVVRPDVGLGSGVATLGRGEGDGPPDRGREGEGEVRVVVRSEGGIQGTAKRTIRFRMSVRLGVTISHK